MFLEMMRVLTILAVLFIVTPLMAQRPTGIKMIHPAGSRNTLQACPPGQGNDAGTVSVGAFTGQSNDTTLNEIFLCFGDELLIDHNGDQNLSGDPDPTTQAGVGYAFFSCPPTVTGEELSLILNDPCLLDNTTPPPPGGIWIATGGTTNGDVLFQNDGSIQNFLFGGDPGEVWFAPITYDALDPTDSSAIFEAGGGCVNVRTDEAFSVVYLNPIDTVSVETPGCSGNITITGGLPEYLGNNDYTVTMTSVANPLDSAQVNIVGVPGAPELARIRFSVPQAGLYDVVIEDGKSCGLTIQVDVPDCAFVTFDLAEEIAAPDSTVCVPIYVSDFLDIRSFQFSIHFDNTILEYIGPGQQNPTMTDGGLYPVSFGPANPNANGELTVSWFYNLFDPNGVTLPDSSVAFEICFTVIGPLGSSSPLTFENQPTGIEVKNAANGDINTILSDGLVLVAEMLQLFVDVDADSVSCGTIVPNPPLTDGSITMTVSGGTAPYTVAWQEDGGPVQPLLVLNGSGQSVTIDNLGAGTYYVTVTDSQMPPEVFTDTITLTAPVPLAVGPSSTDPLCSGDSTGTFSITVNGGISPYNFAWNNGDTIQNIDSLVAGFYQVIVTDQNGCTATASGSLFDPAPIVTTVSEVDATCSGILDGGASVSATGGTAPGGTYGYAWSTTPVVSQPAVTGLNVGIWRVTVTDDNGCEVVDSAVIGAATILLANAVVENVSCFGLTDGSVSLNPSAIGVDNGGYTFSWPGGIGGPADNQVTGLAAGQYHVTIQDALGCNIDSIWSVNEPPLLALDTVSLIQESCAVGNDGSIEVVATGGTLAAGSSYVYVWSDGQTGPVASNLSAGAYTVSVTDDNACESTLTVEILAPSPPVIAGFQITDVSCFGFSDGSITVTVTPGGTPIASVVWSDGGTGLTNSGLAAGGYGVTVTDQSGCSAGGLATVGTPDQLEIVDTTFTLPTCAGECNGNIALQMGGGTSPYTFEWDNGQQTNPAFALCADIYEVTITDQNGCPPLIAVLQLDEPNPVTISIDPASVQGVSCFGGSPCDGTASATATGGGAGTGLYTFLWSSGTTDVNVSSSTATNLCQDVQTLTVSDANGCTATDSVTISAPPELLLDTLATLAQDVSCSGGTDGSITAAATGGTPGYTYTWLGLGLSGPSVNNLQAGTYEVVINDANGCAALGVVTLSEPDPLVLTIDPQLTNNVTCAGDNDGQIKVNVSGGNAAQGGVTYAWSGGVSTQMIATNLAAGTYSVTATDAGGCTATLQHTVSSPPPIIVELQDSIPSARCFGESVTFNIDTIYGGDVPLYETAVNGFDRRQVFGFPHAITMAPGNNILTIIDGNGCRLELPIFIAEPPALAVDLGPDFEIALGDTSTVLEALLLNGQDPSTLDSVLWSPADFISGCLDPACLLVTINPFEETTYSVTITDQNGCTGTASVTVSIDKRRNVYIPNVFSPNDDGFNDQWRISAGQDVSLVNYLRIYDRWGELIYEADRFVPNDNSSEFWDGTFRGKKLPPDVFVYLAEIEFVDGRVLLYRGTITLVR